VRVAWDMSRGTAADGRGLYTPREASPNLPKGSVDFDTAGKEVMKYLLMSLPMSVPAAAVTWPAGLALNEALAKNLRDGNPFGGTAFPAFRAALGADPGSLRPPLSLTGDYRPHNLDNLRLVPPAGRGDEGLKPATERAERAPVRTPAVMQTTAATQFEHPVERALPDDVDQTYPPTGRDEFGLPVWERRVVQNLQKIARLEQEIARRSLGGNPPGGEIPSEFLEVIDRALKTLRTLGLDDDAAKRARPGLIAAFEQLGLPGRAFDLRAEHTAEGYQFTAVRMDPNIYRTNSEGTREYLIDALRVVTPSGTICDGFTGRRTAPLPDDPGADALQGMTVPGLRREIARLKQETDGFYGSGSGSAAPQAGVRLPPQLMPFLRQAIPGLGLKGKEAERMRDGTVKAAGQLDSGLTMDPSARFSFGARPEVSQLVVLRRENRGIVGARIVTPAGAIFDGFTGRRTDLP
jgi:hypothetical protein